jgi:hypothetical protein
VVSGGGPRAVVGGERSGIILRCLFDLCRAGRRIFGIDRRAGSLPLAPAWKGERSTLRSLRRSTAAVRNGRGWGGPVRRRARVFPCGASSRSVRYANSMRSLPCRVPRQARDAWSVPVFPHDVGLGPPAARATRKAGPDRTGRPRPAPTKVCRTKLPAGTRCASAQRPERAAPAAECRDASVLNGVTRARSSRAAPQASHQRR